MTHEELGLDDFLSHSNNAPRNKRLSKWKDKGYVNTILHPKAPIVAIYQHQIPDVVDFKMKDETTRKVWSQSYNCSETNEVLKAQTRRDTNGNRQIPPCSCGICKLYEYIRGQIREGRISWVAPLFRMEGDDPQDTTVIHTGGFCDLYKWDDLTAEEKKELKDARIFPKNSWKESGKAKMNYIFRVVDMDALDQGVQVATETFLLGDKVKVVISDARKSDGVEAGNPFLNPYCITWEFKPTETEFNKKYHAYQNRTPDYRVTPQVRKILESAPPDISAETAPFKPELLASKLEKYSQIKGIPFEELFLGKQFKAIAQVKEDVKPSVQMVECENCGETMRADASRCPHCGAKYEITEDEAPPPPPKKIPTRSEAKKASKQTPHPDDEFTQGETDEIPFLT